jgi:branched-chain amino acid transport system permease protein
LVGSFYVHYSHIIEPTSFGGFFSIYIQLYSVLGGIEYYILGPIIGATIMTFIPEWLRITSAFNPVFTGAFLIIVILFFRGGILGTLLNKLPVPKISKALTVASGWFNISPKR